MHWAGFPKAPSYQKPKGPAGEPASPWGVVFRVYEPGLEDRSPASDSLRVLELLLHGRVVMVTLRKRLPHLGLHLRLVHGRSS